MVTRTGTTARTLRIGVATPAQMRARTVAIARGEIRPEPDEPKLWVPSMEALGRVLSAQNAALLAEIRSRRPASVTDLSRALDRKPSNVLRTLRTLQRYGLVELHRGVGRAVRPDVPYDDLDIRMSLGAAVP